MKGYRFDNIRLEPVLELSSLEKIALVNGSTVTTPGLDENRQKTAVIPIDLRDQTIGVISVKLREDYLEDTVSTLELVSERFAAALESARLYEDARQRADHEQSVAQITSAISAANSYEEILQTTIREIGTTLRDTEVRIQITGDTNNNGQDG
jgi:GAF domain-containing protein